MATTFTLPKKKSVIFWPVGTGDSTTLILKPNDIVMQIDLHHMEKADDKENPEWPVIDHLVRDLPKKNNKPYLALFVLTHPDQDHIRGFEELLKKVTIGEIWHTPKIFRDQADQESLCEDAIAFRKEADRRRKIILKDPSNVSSGDRLRVIGHDDILKEDEKYKNLPESCKSRPGDIVSKVDGNELTSDFQAFIHAPFKDDQAKDKNNTSLALNVVIFEGDKYGQFFFFGDREYPTIKRIFETTEASEKTTSRGYLYYNAMLCAHHCSKAVMYWQDEGETEEKLKKDIMQYFEKYNRENKDKEKIGYIVSSSHANFTDGDGDLPPHKKARVQYEKVVSSGKFICTHEYPNKDNPVPLVFIVDKDGATLDDKRKESQSAAALVAAVAGGRAQVKPPTVHTGFGGCK